jgi:peptide/nickel transport system substrate-binding protein
MILDRDSSNRKLTRREFLRFSVASALGIVAAQQSAFANISSAAAAAPDMRTEYKEAPMLARLVAKGWLPPVAQRLPANPCVIPTLENVRKYGGVMNRAYKGVSDRWGLTKMKDHSFVWFDQNLNLVPRLCESWEINADASQWTFHLRQGTRWSDGAEFSTDDIAWWYQYVLKDTRLTPGIPEGWSAGGQIMALEVVDHYNFKFKFVQPKVLFIYQLARQDSINNAAAVCLCPSHYLKRYHVDFAPDPVALQNEAVAAGYSDWTTYFNQNRSNWDMNPARPDLGPWIAKNVIGQALFVMERNPYYYCVDPENQQLPYVDQVIHKLYNQDSDFINWIKNGVIDFQARGVNFSYYSTLKASETTGGYRVLPGFGSGSLALVLNHTTKNLRLRAFFQQRKVRIALSLAVNRTAMNDSLFNGLAVPRQYSPVSISPQYYPTLSNAHITYDVAQANALLNEAGYTLKDAQGYRLWNDGSGQRISFMIEGISQTGSSDEVAAQQMVGYFAAIGIQAAYFYVDRDTYTLHCNTNQIEAAWFGGDRTILPLAPGAPIFRGIQGDRPWASAWMLWWNNHSDINAEEPPADHWIRTIWSLWDQISAQANEAQRNALFNQILDIWATELPMIGYLGELPALAIVKNNLHNFVAGFPMDDTTADEEVRNPETNSWDSALVPSLNINYPDGQPGSFFTLVGTHYPPNSTALISINAHAINTLFTDANGRFECVLDTSQAGFGIYEVTVKVNPEASTTFALKANAELRPVESAAPQIVVPSKISNNYLYLPVSKK